MLPLLYAVSRRSCMTYARALKSLKPLLLAVHPDLFESRPRLQAVNLASLQRLHLLFSELSQGRLVSGERHEFRFYLKGGGVDSATILTVTASGRLSDSVRQILGQLDSSAAATAACGVSSSPAEPEMPPSPRPSSRDRTLVLASWLASVAPEARAKLAHSRQIADSCARLETALLNRTGAQSISWQSDWTLGHYLRSLSALDTLLSTRPALRQRLLGRRILFAHGKTGPGLLNGHRLLNPADVPEAWLAALLPDEAAMQPQLSRISALERAVSILLHGARLVRHPIAHSSVTLAEYEACLTRLLSGLSALYRRLYADKRFRRSFVRLDLTAKYSLACLSLAVEDSTGHVTRPQEGGGGGGSAIVVCPARNPAFQLLESLIDLAAKEQRDRDAADQLGDCSSGSPAPDWSLVTQLADQCVLKHRLDSLTVDPSLTASVAVDCLESLLSLELANPDSLAELRVRVTRFRSVLGSGEICVPVSQ